MYTSEFWRFVTSVKILVGGKSLVLLAANQ